MSFGKKILANPSNWEFTHTTPKKTHPQKMSERPVEYETRLIGEGLSLYKVGP